MVKERMSPWDEALSRQTATSGRSMRRVASRRYGKDEFGGLPRPVLGLELVECRAYGVRPDPLRAAVHILDAAAPHHPVFARAQPDALSVLAHVPVLLPRALGVALRRVGHLLVREHRSEEHTSELQSLAYLVCRLLLEKKKTKIHHNSNRSLHRLL